MPIAPMLLPLRTMPSASPRLLSNIRDTGAVHTVGIAESATSSKALAVHHIHRYPVVVESIANAAQTRLADAIPIIRAPSLSIAAPMIDHRQFQCNACLNAWCLHGAVEYGPGPEPVSRTIHRH